ncbi:DEAD/DEAH box helicase [Sulfuracidifex tepidarius]|uniref:ATP-dependent DNA helicase Hel308 n=1 Tax=Sulfuracidifex tepidarius TaxID=1294262 RepID=A0A510DV02_9CREN|nr:DEAD/DEAH box helicase [Sulfuracidifex tepidarius]BBG23880.1 ATP-dependent DNA helicase Hel308 [Sulfuracidifex tepidarius]BBG26635.1 ATP-dependent DNA helicase Hel308 [Sulfuracidifex tepidarius]
MHQDLDSRIQILLRQKNWPTLTKIQEMSFSSISTGKNTLIIAPTGYGKTEAAILPLLNQMIKNEVKPVAVIYITPLKALINDISLRIDWWASKLGFLVNRKHGEVPQKEKNLRLKHAPHILVTTPEGLEIDMDWATKFRDFYKNVKWVIVDEVHELINSKRGSQLALLLERLKRFSGYDFQRIGLSATVSSEKVVSDFLFGSSNRERAIIKLEGKRDFEIKIRKISNGSWEDAASSLVSSIEPPSLVFTNSRFSTERLHEELEKLGQKNVFVHHSSISRDIKDMVEEKLRRNESSAVICTKTLELGIHIGEIKKVIMFRPPPSVSSFLQRLGRSGHSVAGTPKGEIISMLDYDILESLALYEMAKHGKIERPLVDDSLDVVARELLGHLLQNQETTAEEFYSIVKGANAFSKVRFSTFLQMVKCLENNGLIKKEGEKIRLGPNFFRVWRFNREFKSIWCKDFSEFFSLINNNDTFSLRFEGKVIGEIDAVYVYKHIRVNDIIRISGRLWKVTRININKMSLDVIPENSRKGEIPIWRGENISKSYLVAKGESMILKRGEIEKEKEILDHDAYSTIKEMLQFYRDRDLPFPSDSTVVVEKRDDEWVYSTIIDEKIANTISHMMLYLTTKRYTLSTYSRASIYGFSIKGAPINLLEELKGMDDEKLVSLIKKSILRSSLFIATMKEIQPSFGKLGRKIDPNNDKFIVAEALRQTVRKYFSIKGTLNFIHKIRDEKTTIVFYNGETPLGDAVLSHVSIRPWLVDIVESIYEALKGGAYTASELSEVLGIPLKSLENKLKQLRKMKDKYKVSSFIDVDNKEVRWVLIEDFQSVVNSDDYFTSFTPSNVDETFIATLKSAERDSQVELIFKPRDVIENPDEIRRRIPFEDIGELKVMDMNDMAYSTPLKFYGISRNVIPYILLNATTYIQSVKFS